MERHMIRERDFKMDVPKSIICRRSKRSCHHFPSWIYTPDLTLRSDEFGNAQRRLTRSRSYVQDPVAGFDVGICNERRGDWGEHSSDVFPMLFPIRSGHTPWTEIRVVLFHAQQYTGSRFLSIASCECRWCD